MSQDPSTSQGDGRVASLVAAVLAKKGLAPVGPKDSLRDAGLSSLDMVNLMLGVEDAFDIALPEDQMTPENFSSVVAIEALIARLT